MALQSRPPAYYPLFLDLSGRRCLVVGGGTVAERKVKVLLGCGARVSVVAPRMTKSFRRLAETKGVKLIERVFRDADVGRAALVFAATNERAVNEKVREAACARGILVNVADSPDLCDFITPSLVRRGPVIIAISTSGLLPMLAKKLRKEIIERLSREYAQYAKKVGGLRRLLAEQVTDRKKRQEILRGISRMDVSEVAAMSMKELRERFLPPP